MPKYWIKCQRVWLGQAATNGIIGTRVCRTCQVSQCVYILDVATWQSADDTKTGAKCRRRRRSLQSLNGVNASACDGVWSVCKAANWVQNQNGNSILYLFSEEYMEEIARTWLLATSLYDFRTLTTKNKRLQEIANHTFGENCYHFIFYYCYYWPCRVFTCWVESVDRSATPSCCSGSRTHTHTHMCAPIYTLWLERARTHMWRWGSFRYIFVEANERHRHTTQLAKSHYIGLHIEL